MTRSIWAISCLLWAFGDLLACSSSAPPTESDVSRSTEPLSAPSAPICSCPLLTVTARRYLDPRNSDLLFQVISRRYDKTSLVLTTNLAFPDVFELRQEWRLGVLLTAA
jgi:hypothetical protein